MPNSSSDFDSYFVLPEEEGLRIDKLLSIRFPEFSRTYFQNLIAKGCVLLGGLPVKKRICPQEGDEIEICFETTPEFSLVPEEIPLDILYEDEHLIAVNKPSGMVVHPAPGNWSGTFANALVFYLGEKALISDPVRPGIVHRLDKETSGVLVAAKTEKAHIKLVELFAHRAMEKKYLAIVTGRPKNGIVNMPIGRHPVHRKEMAILPDGKEAITEVNLLAHKEPLSLVLAKPKTGRTHQIRVHLKHLGAPVLGDTLYGSKRVFQALEPERLFLHAYQLAFIHPITGGRVEFTAPIPEDFKRWIFKISERKEGEEQEDMLAFKRALM